MNTQKIPKYRNQSLKDAARHEPCIVCGRTGTTVLAHSNEYAHGKGGAIKAHDLLGLFLCVHHHDLFDGRRGKMTRQQKQDFFRAYYPKMMVRVCELVMMGEIEL